MNKRLNKPSRLCLSLLLILLLAGCQVELYTNLSEPDANNMLTELLRHGVNGKKAQTQDGRYSLWVEERQTALAIALLRDAGLPREEFESMGDIFQQEGLISSPLEERVRFIYALSQQLQDTLTQIDGVITARVSVVLPENNPFAENVKPSSASVFIKYRPDSNLRDIQSEIKLLVEKSIEGLSYDKVSVTMLPAQPQSKKIAQQVNWQSVGPLQLSATSVGSFWWIIGSLLVLAIAGITGCALLYRRLRQASAVVLHSATVAANDGGSSDGADDKPDGSKLEKKKIVSAPIRLQKT